MDTSFWNGNKIYFWGWNSKRKISIKISQVDKWFSTFSWGNYFTKSASETLFVHPILFSVIIIKHIVKFSNYVRALLYIFHNILPNKKRKSKINSTQYMKYAINVLNSECSIKSYIIILCNECWQKFFREIEYKKREKKTSL